MSIYSLVRKFTVLLVLASLSLTVMDCSKKDDDDASKPSIQITGTWKITNFYQKSGNSAEVDLFPTAVAALPCFAEIIITFKADGTVSANIPTSCQVTAKAILGGDIDKSKYELKGDQLTLTFSDNSKKTITVSLSGNQLSLIDSSTSTTNRIVLTKQ